MLFLGVFVVIWLICTLIGLIQSIRQKVLMYSSTANLFYCVIPAFFGGMFLVLALVDINRSLTFAVFAVFIFFTFFAFTNTAKYNEGILNINCSHYF